MPKKRLLFRLGFFYLALIGFFCRLFPRRVLLCLAAAVGTLYWAIMGHDRRRVERNLRRILEDPGMARSKGWRTFVHYAKYLVDYTRMGLLREENIPCLVRHFQGQEHIDGALKNGKGGLILTAHLGNWEMGGVFLTLLGYSLNVITAPDVAVRLHDYRVRLRNGHRIKVITLNDTFSSSLGVLKALQANELVALLGERELFGKGIPVKFFGRTVSFPIGPPLLASLSGASLIPTFVLLDADDKYLCLAEPPIPMRQSGDRDADLAENAQRVAAVLENFIRRYPEQWFTFYDYFDRHGVA